MFGVLCLLLFCFVIMSRKLPLGETAIVGVVLAIVLGRLKWQVPTAMRWYMLFVAFGTIGFMFASFPGKNSQQLVEVYKLVVIGVALCTVLDSQRYVRIFVIGYLALFALYPVRGSLYNFANGITEAGRIAWNFYFANPNDLAIACILPIGLCGFVMATERVWLRLAAIAGISVLLLVIFLTQSRGVVLGAVAGGVYLLLTSRSRARMLLFLIIAVGIAALVAPKGVWDRMAGLSNASLSDMSGVDVEQSAQSRWAIMGVGIGIASSHPLAGVGIGNYNYFHARQTSGSPNVALGARGFRDTHSMYVRAAAEAGVAGGAAIIAFVYLTTITVRRLRKRVSAVPQGHRHAIGLLALEVSMVAYVTAAVFSSVERTTFMLLQFLLPCIAAVATARNLGLELGESGRARRP